MLPLARSGFEPTGYGQIVVFTHGSVTWQRPRLPLVITMLVTSQVADGTPCSWMPTSFLVPLRFRIGKLAEKSVHPSAAEIGPRGNGGGGEPSAGGREAVH